jgi:chitin synthase
MARDERMLAESLPINTDMYTICLVTCYSEDEHAIKVFTFSFKGTLNSIAATSYPDRRKLIFVICDGLIHGHGNNKSTPEIVIGLIKQNYTLEEPEARSYIAIAGWFFLIY